MSHPPKAILFDVGGTLIESRPSAPEVYARVLSRWGKDVSVGEVAPVFRSVWSELTQLHPRGLDRYHLLKGGEREWWGEFVQRVIGRLGHPAPWEPALAELFAAFADPNLWYVFPEVIDVLTKLRDSHLALAIISNWDSRLPRLLAKLALSHYFDCVLVSAIEGIEKPSPAIFHRAASRLGVLPQDCVHVGDSPLDDYRGGESAGMRCVLIDRLDMFTDSYTKIADLKGLYEHLYI